MSEEQSSLSAQVTMVRSRYRAAHDALNKSEGEEMSLLQSKCNQLGHEWKYHPVAGDGRFCKICDAWDFDDD